MPLLIFWSGLGDGAMNWGESCCTFQGALGGGLGQSAGNRGFREIEPVCKPGPKFVHAVVINSLAPAEWFLRLLFSFAYQDLLFGL